MAMKIHPIPFIAVQCFVIEADSAIMIDAGIPNSLGTLERHLDQIPIDIMDIKLLVISHAHIDHVGNAPQIKAKSQAPILIHQNDQEALETGHGPLPPGITPWGKTLSAFVSPFESTIRAPKVEADLIMDDSGFALHEYGVPGEVIYTPGHTLGSVSVLLENGAAIVGDLAMNGFPKSRKPGIPIFAESIKHVLISWQKLIDRGAQMIYPAHGAPFPAEILQRELIKLSG